jgi:hypothetical protein
MHPALKLRSRPNDDVRRRARTPENLVGEASPSPLRGSVVWNHHEEIVITVGTGGAASVRPEQINALGLVGSDEPTDDLRESRIEYRLNLWHTNLP